MIDYDANADFGNNNHNHHNDVKDKSDAKVFFPTGPEANTAPPLSSAAASATLRVRVNAHARERASVGAGAQDCGIKPEKWRNLALVPVSHAPTQSLTCGFPRQSEESRQVCTAEFRFMVVTDPGANMSRTDEVHRITENVYKVREPTAEP